MSERRVLFIVEGKRGEPRLLKRMHNVLFGTHPGNICYHGTVIHDLISRLFVDGFLDETLDVVSVLRESVDDPERRMILEQEYSDVYLVFDMDPHDPRYDSNMLKTAIRFFSDSTDNGKLYLNYPMLESYRHLKMHYDPGYLNRVVKTDSLGGYKHIVETESHPDFKQLGDYTEETFREIIVMNLQKANWMMGNGGRIPEIDEFLSWEGSEILDVQNRSMDDKDLIYVLNTSVFYPVEFNPSMFLNVHTGCLHHSGYRW